MTKESPITDGGELETQLSGTAYACPDYTDAYDILPSEHWEGGSDIGNLDVDKLKQHALSGIDESFAEKATAGEYEIIVAGDQFGGGGKSIEHPIIAIRGAGVKVVLAESFARYFYRNAINNRLPVLEVPDVLEHVSTGDELSVDLESGTVTNESTDETIQGERLPEKAMDILQSGGGIAYAKAQRLASEN